MAKQSKLNFGSQKKNEIDRSLKTTKKSQNASKTRRITNTIKENIEVVKSSASTAVSNKSVNFNSEAPPFDWCRAYPGSTVSLSSFSLEPNDSYQLKIASWNVNGLRAWIKNGGINYLGNEVPDMLCLQEIKCAKKDIPPTADVEDYISHYYSADKPGYSGTALYSKIKPLSVIYGLGAPKHDKEGRIITAEYEHFYLVNTYVPNSGQGLVRLSYRTKEWNKDMCEHIKKLDSKKPVILTGDLNVSHNEIDLANPEGNRRTAGFTDEERQGFSEMLKNCKMIDTYRHFYPDRKGVYTYWSARHNARKTNAGWRLDYFVVSERLLSNVVDQEIRCGVLGSDHCPLVLYMKF
nr:DNA (apurinic or apyrimidinic site) lyase [Hymenolepis microstoma]